MAGGEEKQKNSKSTFIGNRDFFEQRTEYKFEIAIYHNNSKSDYLNSNSNTVFWKSFPW